MYSAVVDPVKFLVFVPGVRVIVPLPASTLGVGKLTRIWLVTSTPFNVIVISFGSGFTGLPLYTTSSLVVTTTSLISAGVIV